VEPFAATTPQEQSNAEAESTSGTAPAAGAAHIQHTISSSSAAGSDSNADAAAAPVPPASAGSVPCQQDAVSWKDDLAAQLGINSQMAFTVRRTATLTMSWRQAGVHIGIHSIWRH
jgi:hypothetical protein